MTTIEATIRDLELQAKRDRLLIFMGGACFLLVALAIWVVMTT